MSLKANGLSKIKQIRSLSLAPLTILLSSATSSQWVQRANTLLGVRFKTYGFAWKWDAPKFEGLSWFSIILSLFFPIERAINWGSIPHFFWRHAPAPFLRHGWPSVLLPLRSHWSLWGSGLCGTPKGWNHGYNYLGRVDFEFVNTEVGHKSIKVYQITKDDPVTWSNFCLQLLGSF